MKSVPRCPIFLPYVAPPPTIKSQTDLVASIPEVKAICHTLLIFWSISNKIKVEVQGEGAQVSGEWVR